MDFDFEKYKTQGIKVNYYYICKRKLWLFDKGISFEKNFDRVLQGKILHENTFQREKHKDLLIDDMIKIDVVADDHIKEVKISSKMKNPDIMQLLYYLFYLKQLGISKKGTINYVKEKKVVEVELTEEDEKEIKTALIDIKEILMMKKPPEVKKLPYCKKCAYYEYCYAKEVD